MKKILKFVLPKKQWEKIKDESKSWFLHCPDCGYEKSVWDAGGIRVGAKAKGKKEFGYCPDCNKKKLLDVIKK